LPKRVKVNADSRGAPVALGRAKVESVREEWLVEDRWWTPSPLRRRYFELVLDDGRDVVVFRSCRQLVSAEGLMYVELHCHSAFSFIDGASTPLELAAVAAELGYPTLALTDHDGLWGSMEFAQSCKDFGVRPITGAEVTVGNSHLNPAGRIGRRVSEPVSVVDRGASGHKGGCAADGGAAVGVAGRRRAPLRRVGLPVGLREGRSGCGELGPW